MASHLLQLLQTDLAGGGRLRLCVDDDLLGCRPAGGHRHRRRLDHRRHVLHDDLLRGGDRFDGGEEGRGRARGGERGRERPCQVLGELRVEAGLEGTRRLRGAYLLHRQPAHRVLNARLSLQQVALQYRRLRLQVDGGDGGDPSLDFGSDFSDPDQRRGQRGEVVEVNVIGGDRREEVRLVLDGVEVETTVKQVRAEVIGRQLALKVDVLDNIYRRTTVTTRRVGRQATGDCIILFIQLEMCLRLIGTYL